MQEAGPRMQMLDPGETLAWESTGGVRASFQVEVCPFCTSSRCCRISRVCSLHQTTPLPNCPQTSPGKSCTFPFLFAPWIRCQAAHTQVWQGSTTHHTLETSKSRFPIYSEWHRYSELEGLGKEVLLVSLSSPGATRAHIKWIFPKALTLLWNSLMGCRETHGLPWNSLMKLKGWCEFWSLVSARTPGSLEEPGA